MIDHLAHTIVAKIKQQCCQLTKWWRWSTSSWAHSLLVCTANRLPGFVLATSIDYMLQLCEQRLSDWPFETFFNRQMCLLKESCSSHIYIFAILPAICGQLGTFFTSTAKRVCPFWFLILSVSCVFIVGNRSRINRWGKMISGRRFVASFVLRCCTTSVRLWSLV